MSSTLKVGHIDLSFHDASSKEVEKILEQYGHTIQRRTAPHAEMFAQMQEGKIDLLVSAWLPASHDVYLAPFETDVMKITVLYEPYCIWGVPDYVPAEVAKVEDLLADPALSNMDRRIQGINPGAGISRFSKAIMESYALASAGYHFETGSEEDCFDRFEDAYRSRKWIVVPLWHPQYLHNRYEIRALSEPRGLLGGQDQATLIVRKDVVEKIDPNALIVLSNLYLGNARVSQLDDELCNSEKPRKQ